MQPTLPSNARSKTTVRSAGCPSRSLSRAATTADRATWPAGWPRPRSTAMDSAASNSVNRTFEAAAITSRYSAVAPVKRRSP